MLQALATQNTGFGIVILSSVGAYHAPGQDVRRAVAQFNAMAEGLALAGRSIRVILYTDSAAAGSLDAEASTQEFEYERASMLQPFQLNKADGTYI